MGLSSVINIISLGLKLVDQFREFVLRFIVKKLTSPSMIVEQPSDALHVRYEAFNRRIKFNRELYNELFGQLPELAVDERARIKGCLGNTKAEPCKDFPHPFVE